MNVNIFKGGTPVVQFPFCAGNYAQFEAPFINSPVHTFEAYTSHADGAYQIGYFTLGMPIRPSIMKYQRDALADANLAIDDIIRCVWIPADHYAKFLNFKVVGADSRLAGAAVSLTAEKVTRNAQGDFEYTEMDDVETAATAQGLATPIKLDEASNTMLSLVANTDGYAQPLYSGADAVIILGLKIVALPTDTKVKLYHALNAWYMSVKIEGFECPTYL